MTGCLQQNVFKLLEVGSICNGFMWRLSVSADTVWGFFSSAGGLLKAVALGVKHCDVPVDFFINCSDLCSGGGREYQRKFPSILLRNFVSLTWMSLGVCSVLLDSAVRILSWLPKQEQRVTHHHSVCVQPALLLCCVQSARRVRI